MADEATESSNTVRAQDFETNEHGAQHFELDMLPLGLLAYLNGTAPTVSTSPGLRFCAATSRASASLPQALLGARRRWHTRPCPHDPPHRLRRMVARPHARAVAQEYAAEQALAPIRPPAALAAPAAFHAFVEWEASQDLQPAKAYFRRLLRGAVAPEPFGTLIDSVGATTARSAPIGRCSEAARSRLDLDVSSLDLLASSLGCSLVSAMHAAWSIYYAARSGRRDVLYATTTSGRSAPIPHGERIVGLVLNTLPVRIRLDARQHEDDDESCFSGLIRRQAVARTALQHRSDPAQSRP